jgi:endonuclease-3
MSQAFGIPAFPVDTHIHRLAARWQLSSGRNVEQTERDLKATFPEERWNSLHLQIIYFGRSHCPARGHIPARCPICSWAMSSAQMAREARSPTQPKQNSAKKPKHHSAKKPKPHSAKKPKHHSAKKPK